MNKLLRETSYKNAEKIIEKSPTDEFEWILNDLWDYNAIRWLDNTDAANTIGQETVIYHGFTTNQLRWIKETIKLLEQVNE